jgi:glycosyltransferase involved in cell wall biosynthesis
MSSNKKKIAIIDAAEYRTGAYKSITEYIKLLSNDFEFYLFFSKQIDDISSDSIHFVEFKYSRLKRTLRSILKYPFLLIKESYKMHKLAKANGIQVFHMNDMFYLHGVFLRLFGYKVIYHIRLLPSSYIGNAYKFYIFITKIFANKVLVVSNFLKTYYGIKAVLIYDRIRFEENEPLYQLSESTTKIMKILVVGNYIVGKGHIHALKALEMAFYKGFVGSLDFFGDDDSNERKEFRQSLQNEVNISGLSKYVFLHSSCENIEELYKKFDVLINLSESESFSMVNLEAMYYGLATISANSEGPCEQIINNETGFLVEFDNYEKISDLLIALQKDPNKHKEISRKGKVHVESMFFEKKYLNILKKIYQEI